MTGYQHNVSHLNSAPSRSSTFSVAKKHPPQAFPEDLACAIFKNGEDHWDIVGLEGFNGINICIYVYISIYSNSIDIMF